MNNYFNYFACFSYSVQEFCPLVLKMLYQGTWSHSHEINNNNNNNRLALSLTITNQNTVLQKLFITYY